MKKVSQSVDDILSNYLDGNLSTSEMLKAEENIRSNPAWQERLDELKLINMLLDQNPVEQPSRTFTDEVMSRLHQYPSSAGFSVRKGILLLTGILVVIGIATILLSTGAFDNITTNIDLNQIEVSRKFVKTPLPSFELNGKFIVNMIIILNLGLGWIVLDRTILRPFFQRRMQAGH
jgi:hypothetical protein